jgi:regulatory subunit for Cdc7p protein kinase
MAAVSLSPPVSLSATMSTSRRIPLAANQNIANSPLRASALAKPKRSYVNLQPREENYAQPPPAKKQIIDSGIPRPLKSPSSNQSRPVARSQLSLQPRRVASTYESKLARERGQHHTGHHAESTNTGKYTERDLEEIRQWQSHHRARFPRMVFYFDSIPEDVRVKIVKQVSSLGAVSCVPDASLMHGDRGILAD